MIIAILWSPVIAKFDSIFEAINILLTVISPPISAVFIWGVFWKRGNNPAAIATFSGGFVLGLIAFLVDFPIIGEVKYFTEGLGISFMMQAWWLFVACSVIYVVTSLLTPAPDYEKIKNYTLASPGAFLKDYKEKGNKEPLVLSAVLFTIMVILYGIFS